MESKIQIIAEIGWNHMGDMHLAEKMIINAALSGADFCKFQTWRVSNLKKGPWDKDGRIDIYKKAELTEDKHKKLLKICNQNGIKFMTSVFNINDIDFISSISNEIIKIPSHEVFNVDLIQKAQEKFKTVLISIGACTWNEFKNLYEKIDLNKNVYFLHCVSSYPLDAENVNMQKLGEIFKLHKKIGYSGHLSGIDDAILAISKGAQFIEKHFTIDNNLPGRDNKFAIKEHEMRRLVEFKNTYLKMMENKGLDVQECEMDIYKNYRGRWSKK
tara:strand:- start:3296 stop:4111 length:816 start_codon:yes stop_codon:yes gene_type:complete